MPAHEPMPPDGLPVQALAVEAAWAAWLLAHADAAGLCLKIGKPRNAVTSVRDARALDVARSHRWSDAQKRGFDDARRLQRFMPRRARSLWSARNVGPVDLREIEAAQAKGRWDAAYAGAASMAAADALQAALATSPGAQASPRSGGPTTTRCVSAARR